MGKRRATHPFEDNPVIEGFLDWMDAPEGQQSIEASDLVFAALADAGVDARQRKIVWADGKRLSIEQSAERIHAEHPSLPRDLIETHVLGWLESCVPESCSERQLAELDRLIEPWLEDYERTSRTVRSSPRTRHSRGTFRKMDKQSVIGFLKASGSHDADISKWDTWGSPECIQKQGNVYAYAPETRMERLLEYVGRGKLHSMIDGAVRAKTAQWNLALGVIAILLIGTCPTFADQMTITQTAKPVEFSYPGVSLDNLGIKLGMTEADALKIISEDSNYKLDSQVQFSSMFAREKGISMWSQSFPFSITARDKDGGDIVVYLATPATENEVVDVELSLVYPNDKNAPTLAGFEAALDKKYGPDTKELISSTGGVILWVFDETGHLGSCPKASGMFCDVSGPGCGAGTDPTEGALYSNNRSYSEGNDVFIEASYTLSSFGPVRISTAQISLSNEADKAISDEAAAKQIDAALVIASTKASRPTAVAKALSVGMAGASAVASIAQPISGQISFYGDIGNIIDGQTPIIAPPSIFYLAEDGSVVLEKLQWSGWGTSVAQATGLWSASDCTPSCANGKLTTSPVTLTLSSPGSVLGHMVYRCVTWTPAHPKLDAWGSPECIQKKDNVYAYTPVSTP